MTSCGSKKLSEQKEILAQDQEMLPNTKCLQLESASFRNLAFTIFYDKRMSRKGKKYNI